MGMLPPPIVIGGAKKEAGSVMEQAPHRAGRGLVWLSVAWLAGGCVCACVFDDGGLWGLGMLQHWALC
jgi:hypothetical protein